MLKSIIFIRGTIKIIYVLKYILLVRFLRYHDFDCKNLLEGPLYYMVRTHIRTHLIERN